MAYKMPHISHLLHPSPPLPLHRWISSYSIMSINIPSNPAPNGYVPRPQEYTEALAKAQALLDAETDPANEDSWQEQPEREGVTLHSKPNPENPSDVPLVKGKVTIENATPEQVLAAIQLPGMRKKWDARIEDGFAVQRYSPQSYLFYSVMKSPSYFIWARDICGIQENKTSADRSSITVLQTSVDNEEFVPEAGSYAKSRTRATVELSGWKFEKKGDDTELTYVVKIFLNGNIPTAIVSSIAAETPMCCAKIRDAFYTTGWAPYEIHRDNAITCNQTQTFEDGDGSEATSGEKKWTGSFRGNGADTVEIAYDSQRMYSSGVNVEITGEAKDSVTASVDESGSKVIVKVEEGAKDKDFQVIITPQ